MQIKTLEQLSQDDRNMAHRKAHLIIVNSRYYFQETTNWLDTRQAMDDCDWGKDAAFLCDRDNTQQPTDADYKYCVATEE